MCVSSEKRGRPSDPDLKLAISLLLAALKVFLVAPSPRSALNQQSQKKCQTLRVWTSWMVTLSTYLLKCEMCKRLDIYLFILLLQTLPVNKQTEKNFSHHEQRRRRPLMLRSSVACSVHGRLKDVVKSGYLHYFYTTAQPRSILHLHHSVCRCMCSKKAAREVTRFC